MKEKMLHLPQTDNIKERVKNFNNTLIESANVHVGKCKPSRKPKLWTTPNVKAAIRKRNALRKKVKTQRKEWLDACKEARDEINKAKEENNF